MLSTKNINYIHFDVIDSTNTWAKNNAHVLDHRGYTCITAEEQTQGKGTFGKRWVSPKGQNIYATLFFCVPQNFPYVANIGQVLSISCASVLSLLGFDARIKWPNDILIDGKKVAGILCETTTAEQYLGIVLGIGINVNMTEEMLKVIDQPASSLAQLSTHTWNLEQVLEPLLNQFIIDLETLKKKGFVPFQKAYENLLIVKDKSINFKLGEKVEQGTYHSISDEGRLVITMPDGNIKHLSSTLNV